MRHGVVRMPVLERDNLLLPTTSESAEGGEPTINYSTKNT